MFIGEGTPDVEVVSSTPFRETEVAEDSLISIDPTSGMPALPTALTDVINTANFDTLDATLAGLDITLGGINIAGLSVQQESEESAADADQSGIALAEDQSLIPIEPPGIKLPADQEEEDEFAQSETGEKSDKVAAKANEQKPLELTFEYPNIEVPVFGTLMMFNFNLMGEGNTVTVWEEKPALGYTSALLPVLGNAGEE